MQSLMKLAFSFRSALRRGARSAAGAPGRAAGASRGERMALSVWARGGRMALWGVAAAVLLGVLGAPSGAQAQCRVGIASSSGGTVDNGATINVPIQLTGCADVANSPALGVRLRIPYWITTPTGGGTNNTHISNPQPPVNSVSRVGWRSFFDFAQLDIPSSGAGTVNIPLRIAGGDPIGAAVYNVTDGNQFVFRLVASVQAGIAGTGGSTVYSLGSGFTDGTLPVVIDTSSLSPAPGTQNRVRLFATGGGTTQTFGAAGLAVNSNTYTINSGGNLAAATLVVTTEDDAGNVRTQFREGERVNLRVAATQPDGETGVSYTSSWLQRFGLDITAAQVVGNALTITDADDSDFDASFITPAMNASNQGSIYMHVTARGSKPTFTSSPVLRAATSITIDTSSGPTALAAPTLTPRAEDTSGATQTEFNTGATVNLRASATQSDSETGVAYTSRWEQVDGPGAGANVVTAGAVTITDTADSDFDASFTAPSVAGMLFFRITANGSKTGFTDSPEASATTTITITAPTPTLAAPTLVPTAEDADGNTQTEFNTGAAVNLRASATQSDSETGVAYTSRWEQVDGPGPGAAVVVGGVVVTIVDTAASDFDATFTAPSVAATLFFRVTASGAKTGFNASPEASATTAAISITVPTLAAPTIVGSVTNAAGNAQTSFETGDTVNLGATATQTDGETGVAYTSRWEQVDGTGAGANVVTAGAVTLTDADTSNFDASFTAPAVTGSAVATLFFRAAATGSKSGFTNSPEGVSPVLTITITAPTLGNPVVVASASPNPANQGDTVTLSATITDPDGEPGVTFTSTWEQVDSSGTVITTGPTIAKPSPTSAAASFQATQPGDRFYRLRVTSSKTGFEPSSEATDTVTITVNIPALPDVVVTVTDISAPEGTLSGDPAVLTAGTVSLTGSGSVPGNTDATINYRWRQVDGDDPATAMEVSSGPTFVGAITHDDDTPGTAASFTAPDVSTQTAYYFRLSGQATKTFFSGSEGSAILTVTISDVEPPVASIAVESAAITRQVPGSSPEAAFRIRVEQGTTTNFASDGLLTVSASDPDSDTVTCAWTVMGGGRGVVANNTAGVTLSDASSCTPSVDWPASVAGSYVSPYNFALTVTDSNGLTDSASVSWAVINPRNPRARISPTSQDANPGASVTLSGSQSQSASLDDGLVAGFGGSFVLPAGTGYRWAQTASASSDTPLTSADMGYVLDGVNTTQVTLNFNAPSTPGTVVHILLTAIDPINDAMDTTRATVTVTAAFTAAISGGAATVAEGVAPAAYTATLTAIGSATRSEAVTVTWSVGNTSATDDNDAEPGDFCNAGGAPFGALQTGTVTMGTGANTMNFNLPQICDDALLEGAETFEVSFSVSGESLSSFASNTAATAVSITDGDSATVSITRTDSDGFTEGGSGAAATAVFTVTIAGATTTADAEITFGISGDVAADDTSSVSPAAPTLTIPSGMASGTISVTANDDNEIEDAENLTITLSAASSAGAISVTSTPGGDSATAALADDEDRTVRVVLDDNDGFTEGGSGNAGRANFRFSMGGTLPQSVNIAYQISGEGITAGDVDTLGGGLNRVIGISAGQTRAFGGPTAVTDMLLEGTEELTVTITGVTTAATVKPVVASDGGETATANISDANSVVATLSGGGSVTEGVPAVVTVALSGATHTQAVVVNYTIAADSDPATANATLTDYTDAGSGSLTIPVGMSAGLITINTVNDDLNEPDEVFVFSVADSQVTSNGAVTAAGSPQTFTIADNDDITYSVALQGGNAPRSETGSVTFTVRLSGGRLPTAASVVATVVGDVEADDYTIANPPSETASTNVMLSPSGTDTFEVVTIQINEDTLNEGDETLTLRIAEPTFANSGGFTAGATEASVPLLRNDPLRVSIAGPSGDVEEGSNAEFTVTLTTASEADAMVAFAASITTQSMTANPDANPDFTLSTPTASPLVIPAGETTGTITIAINTDLLAEGAEDLVVMLSGVTLGTGGGFGAVESTLASATATIATNTASTYVVRFANPPTAIAETATATTITVRLVGPMFSGAVEIDWSFAAGDTVAADFTSLPAGGILNFTNSNRDQTFTITPAADTLAEGGSEGGESFMLRLAANASLDTARQVALGGVQITAEHSIAITDDDAIELTVTPSGASLAEDSGTLTYTVSFMTTTSTEAVMVPFTIAAPATGTAAVAADYDITMPGGINAAAIGGTLEIAAGASTGDIVITGSPDVLLEGDEGFTLQIGEPSGGGGAPPTNLSSPSAATINDAERLQVAVARDTDSDGFMENAAGSAAQTTFTVTLSGAELTTAASVEFSVDGCGDSFEDCTFDPASPLILQPPAPGVEMVSASVTVSAEDDNLNENAETITLEVASVTTTGAVATTFPVSATAMLSEDDADAITVTIEREGSGDVAEDGEVTFSVTLGGSVRTQVVVMPFGVSGLSDVEFDIEGVVPPSSAASFGGALVFAADGSETATDSLTFRINLLDDNLNEATETLAVTGNAAGPSGLRMGEAGAAIGYTEGGNTASVRVTDDDGILVSIARTTPPAGEVEEGATVVFTITLDGASGGSTRSVMVPWMAVMDSQTNAVGEDNDAARPDLSAADTTTNTGVMLAGTVTVPINMSSATLSITAANDGFAETDESFTVTIATPSGGAGSVEIGSPTSASVGINENPAAVHVVSVAGPDAAVAEGGMAVFTLSLPAITGSNARTAPLTVNYSLGGSAASGSDYTHTGTSATFAASSASETVSILITADMLNEGQETLTLTLTSVADAGTFPGGASAGGSASATISASDPVTYGVGAAPAVTEGNSGTLTMSFPVTLSGATNGSAAAITIPYTLGGSATGGTDYETPSPRTVTVPANTATANLEITVNGDELNEADETIRVTLGGTATVAAGGGTAMRTANAADFTATGTITDDDSISVTLEAPADADPDTTGIQVDESSVAVFTVRLSGASAGVVMATITVAAVGGATAADDLEGAVPATVSVPAGETSATFSIRVAYDGMDEMGEGFDISIGTPTGDANAGNIMLGATVQQTILLADTNVLRTLAVSAADADEGGNLVFTVTLTGTALLEAFDVAWSLNADMSSAAAEDYTGAASGTLNFGVSSELTQTRTLTFAAVDDALNEGPETLVLTLTNPCPSSGICAVGGRLPTDSADAPTLGLSSEPATATATIGASDPIAVSLARRAGDSGRLVSGDAAFYTATLGATASTDLMLVFEATWGTRSTTTNVSVAAGATEADVTLPAVLLDAAAAAASGEVQLAAEVTGVSGAPSGATAAPGTDAAADAIGVVGWELSVSPAGSDTDRTQVGEGGPFEVTVSLRGTPAPGVLMAPWIVSGSGTTAATAADFPGGAFPSGTLELSNQTSGAITVQTLADTVDESAGAEGFTVAIGALTGTNAGAVVIESGMAFAAIADARCTVGTSTMTASVDEDSVSGAGEVARAVFIFTQRCTAGTSVGTVAVPWSLESPDSSLTLTAAAASGAGGREPGARDLGPGAAVSGTVTFPAVTSFSTPQTVRVEVPIAQDALNEGAEQLRLAIGTVDATAGGCSAGGIPCTLVSQSTADTMVAASDDITIFIAPAADQGTLTQGEAAQYVMSFGTTMVNGVAVPIVPTADITIPVVATVGGTATTVNVPVTAGAATVNVEIPAATIDAAGQSSTTTLVVAVDTASLPAAAAAAGGGTLAAGTAANLAAQPVVQGHTPPVATPAPQQVAGWVLTIARAAGTSETDAPEGTSYELDFTLEGDPARLGANGLTMGWSVAARGANPARVEDFGRGADYDCSPDADTGACSVFPSGTVTFTTGDARMTLSIAIFDDGMDEGMTAEGFSLTLQALGGANAGLTELATGGLQPGALELQIPALRADLSIADAAAQEGETARFVLTLSDFSGGAATTAVVTVNYAVGAVGDTATRGDSAQTGGADYVSAATAAITIPVGETAGQGSTAIAIPLLADGVLDPRERFSVTIVSATGGGGSIRLMDTTATGSIGDAADTEKRRGERVSTLVSVLDRSTAILATDAIGQRLDRGMERGTAQAAQLSIANRALVGASGQSASAGSAQAASDIGLALYGAPGMGGASAGLPGGGNSGGLASPGGGAAFDGLGAGLAGGANMGSRTALPNLAQLLRGSRFSFSAAGWMDFSNVAEDVQVWGSGGFTDLEGDPQQGAAKLSYEGDNFAFFLGADRPVREDMLAGVALGYSVGDLDFTDKSGDFTLRGNLSSGMLSVHPYLGWWITPNMNAWLVLGYGSGSVDMDEEELGADDAVLHQRTLPGDSDSNMWMFATGLASRMQLTGATGLKLSVSLARVHSELDSARFGDGALLPKLSAHSMRVGGEAEVNHRLRIGGVEIEPFVSARMRIESGDAVEQGAGQSRDAAFDVGGGVAANMPSLGLDGRLSVSGQLNETGHDERRVSVDLNFDLLGDAQGLTMSVRTEIAERSGGLLAATAGLSGLDHGSSLGGSLAGGVGRLEQSVSGEVGYGMALGSFGRSGLLTPYGRFDLGQNDSRYAAGLRLEAADGLQVGLEGGFTLDDAAAANAPRDYQLLLKGQLRF